MSRREPQAELKIPFVMENLTNRDLPALLEKTAEGKSFLTEKLLAHGALLFRGWRVETVSDFENFVRAFAGRELFGYAGGVSPRNALSAGGVYTSTEYPPEIGLSLHNELSYSEVFPETLYFCCLVEPDSGGETTLGDSRGILRKIEREVVEVFQRKKICYIRSLTGDPSSVYSWQAAFETENIKEAENMCRRAGANFEWLPAGGLKILQTRPATLTHPITRQEVWFNQADGFHPSNLGLEHYESIDENEFRLNCTFGDGSKIDAEMLAHIRAVLKSETIPHKWQKGDVLILDNLLAAHGRRPFRGARKIVLAMT